MRKRDAMVPEMSLADVQNMVRGITRMV
jgi:hypothetical protein